jgi:hypothetical protein
VTNRQLRRVVGLVTATVAATFGVTVAQAEPNMRRLDDDRVMITEFKGKPPFKRRIVKIDQLSPTEFARFEALRPDSAIDSSRVGERVRTVDFRGKPPFRRQTVKIDASNASEFARFEETDQTVEPATRKGRALNDRFPVRR